MGRDVQVDYKREEETMLARVDMKHNERNVGEVRTACGDGDDAMQERGDVSVQSVRSESESAC